MKRRNSITDSVCTKGGSVIPFNYSFTLRHATNAKYSSYDSMYILNLTAKGWFYSSLENQAYNLETDQPPLRLWKAERPGCNLFNISKFKVQRESQHVFNLSELQLVILYSQRIEQVCLGTKLFSKSQSLDTTKVSFSNVWERPPSLSCTIWYFSPRSKERNKKSAKGSSLPLYSQTDKNFCSHFTGPNNSHDLTAQVQEAGRRGEGTPQWLNIALKKANETTLRFLKTVKSDITCKSIDMHRNYRQLMQITNFAYG